MFRFWFVVAASSVCMAPLASAQSDCVEGAVVAQLADGTEVPYGKLELSLYRNDNADGLVGSAVTDEEGAFVFQDVEAGEYILEITLFFEGDLIAVEQVVRFVGGSCGRLPVISIPPPAKLAEAKSVVRRIDGVGGKSFHPIALFQKDGLSYAISEAGSEVYLMARNSASFQKIGKLNVRGTVTDHCLLELAGSAYIISISHDDSLLAWRRNYIHVTPLASVGSRSEEGRRKTIFRSRKYHGAHCDSRDPSLYLTDTISEAVFKFEVTGRGVIGDEEHVFSLRRGCRPVSLAKRGDLLFVGGNGRSCILRVDLADRSRSVIADGYYHPLGLAVSADGNHLLFGDDLKKRVMSYDIGSGALRMLFDRSDGLRTPAAISLDHAGTLLVADPGKNVIFELKKRMPLRLDEPER